MPPPFSLGNQLPNAPGSSLCSPRWVCGVRRTTHSSPRSPVPCLHPRKHLAQQIKETTVGCSTGLGDVNSLVFTQWDHDPRLISWQLRVVPLFTLKQSDLSDKLYCQPALQVPWIDWWRSLKQLQESTIQFVQDVKAISRSYKSLNFSEGQIEWEYNIIWATLILVSYSL